MNELKIGEIRVVTISVVIPLYNKANYIERALRSVLNQNKALCREIVVVDDGSSDGSHKVVERLCQHDDRIKLVRQTNAGVSAARNTGIKYASNEYIALLDADDQWQPWFLDEVARLINAFPEVSVYATSYERMVGDGQVKKPRFRHVPQTDIGLIDRYLYASVNSSSTPITSSSVSVHRPALLAVGGFPEGMSQAEDKLTWTKLSLEYSFAWSPRSSMLQDMATENQSNSTWGPASADEYITWLQDVIAFRCKIPGASSCSKTTCADLKLALLAQRELVFRKAVRNSFYGYAFRTLVALCYSAPPRRVPRYVITLCLPQMLKIRIRKLLKKQRIQHKNRIL